MAQASFEPLGLSIAVAKDRAIESLMQVRASRGMRRGLWLSVPAVAHVIASKDQIATGLSAEGFRAADMAVGSNRLCHIEGCDLPSCLHSTPGGVMSRSHDACRTRQPSSGRVHGCMAPLQHHM